MRDVPICRDGTLTYQWQETTHTIQVGTPEWDSWLAHATTFVVLDELGTFTVSKERAGNKRGEWYWRASCRCNGVRHRTYLGKAENITRARLHEVAKLLTQRGHSHTHKRQQADVTPTHDQFQNGSLPGSTQPVPQQSHDAARSTKRYPPLLTTKLFIPLVHERIVTRPRLLERLQQVTYHALTLVLAPAGFGKTTLLSQWCAMLRGAQTSHSMQSGAAHTLAAPHSPAVSVAWLSLDKGDNDPTTFWHYFIAALETLQADIWDEALELLFSAQPPSIHMILTIIINTMSRLPHIHVLVLDDYHLIKTPAIHDALSFFLKHMPASLHLVIASRVDPPLPLIQLRAQRRLYQIDTSELRFREEETSVFFEQETGLHIAQHMLATLDRRIEGWIVGLQLVALTLRTCSDTASFIEKFTTHPLAHDYIIEYLSEEVLYQQSAEVQNFLLRTSILDRLQASLCDALLEQPVSQSILEHLEHAHLFIVSLDEDRRWYRYHPLFAAFLSTRLRQTQASLLPLLHHKASLWYEEQNLLPLSIEHALSAHEWERAARLVEEVAGTLLLRQGEYGTLQEWLDSIPPEIVRSHPALSFAQACIWITNGSLTMVETCLHDAETALDPEREEETALQSKILALHAFVALRQGNAALALSQSLQTLACLPPQEELWRSMTEQLLATAHFMLGNVKEADETWRRLLSESRATRKPHVTLPALRSLAQVQMIQGHLHQAAATCQEALSLVPQDQLLYLQGYGYIHIWLGNMYYEWNDLDNAKKHLREALTSGQHTRNMEMLVPGSLGLLRIAYIQQDGNTVDTLSKYMEQLLVDLERSNSGERIIAIRASLAIVRGDIEEAAYHCQEAGLSLENKEAVASLANPNSVSIYLIWVQVLLAQNNISEALALLAKLRQHIVAHYQHNLIQLLALQALAFFTQGEMQQAVTTLVSALSPAAAEEYTRTFIDLGTAMAKLLSHLLTRRTLAPHLVKYVRRLLVVFAHDTQQTPFSLHLDRVTHLHQKDDVAPPVLSERERDIVRLMAQGYSDRAIARQLMLTENTVKTYAKRMYAKLDVKNRTQAVVRAREFQIL
ncbi:MAG: hypothetical protein H0W02_12675 [Ktedonobacteraceae bacterium]|nr:hypothetical protein [Ktedonobacteraceae bacterium]